jgi:hypothetical protein
MARLAWRFSEKRFIANPANTIFKRDQKTTAARCSGPIDNAAFSRPSSLGQELKR